MTTSTKHPGGRPRKLTLLEEKNIIVLWQNGTPINEIIYKQNISVSTFQRIVKRYKEKTTNA